MFLQIWLLVLRVYSPATPELEWKGNYRDYLQVFSISVSIITTNYSVVSFFLDRHLGKDAKLVDGAKLLAIELASIVSQPVLTFTSLLLFCLQIWHFLFIYPVYVATLVISANVYSRRSSFRCSPYFMILFELFYFDIFFQNSSLENKTSLNTERRKRVHIKCLKACVRLVMFIFLVILVKPKYLSNARFDGKNMASFTWPLFHYILASLFISIVMNLVEVKQYQRSGTTWIDWIFNRSVLIEDNHHLAHDED